MESVEDLVVELKALTPDQLDRVARIVHELSRGINAQAGRSDDLAPPQYAAVPRTVLEEAVRNGWPAALFVEVIGQIADDFQRPAQRPHEARRAL